MNTWANCKRILCVRLDNIGDVIMTSPALRAIKETFGCNITMLVSAAGAGITPHIPEIDDVITCNVPWMKMPGANNSGELSHLIETLKEKRFDGAIIFTVCSQTALPAALAVLMAGIPLRLAYSRENPYELLTDWIPDKEPYDFIRHQVERDMKLVSHIGAVAGDDRLSLSYTLKAKHNIYNKLASIGIRSGEPFVVLHPGVSEKKREYPKDLWIETGRLLNERYGMPMILTGVANERAAADAIREGIGWNVCNMAGECSLDEFIALIDASRLVITVNTATVHIAAALEKPSIVLYATTNPQHVPWKTPANVLYFPVLEELRSRNQIVRFISDQMKGFASDYPLPGSIVQSAGKLLSLYS